MGFTSAGQVDTPTLSVAYEHSGPTDAVPVILLHGFPYDVRAFDEVAPLLARRNAWVVAPYLRGFGATSFRDDATPRSGQQAALGTDLVEFMDALGIESAVLAGYDWGGRAACITAAVHPERVRGLVTVDGYNVQDIAAAHEPGKPEWEATYWYQYYFHPSVAAAGWSATAKSCASSCGAPGRRRGPVPPRRSPRARPACTTRTSPTS